MKILNVSYSDLFGGAAKSSYRIHKSLSFIRKGIESKMIVVKKESNDDNIIQFKSNLVKLSFKIKNYIGIIISKFDRNKNPTSYNFFNSPILEFINKSNFDIINLHWINAETISINDIKKIEKPYIITMHDMWWLCGTENYLEYRDNSWKNGEFNNLLSNIKFKDKFNLKPIAIICPSKWLMQISKKSKIYSKKKIVYIPYPINQKIFFPRKINKIENLNLKKNKKIKIFFAVFGNPNDKRKGFDLLLKSLTRIDNSKFELIVAGKNKINISQFDIKYVNYIKNEQELSKIYNLSDIVVIPSRLDNLPNVALEAQSCGKPIIAYNVGGLSDIVKDGINGYLISPFNYKQFAIKLNLLIKNKIKRKKFQKEAYLFAKKNWNEKKVRSKYEKFFKNLN